MPLGIALNAIRSLKNSLQGFVSILGGYLGYSDLPLRTGGLLISSNYDIDSNNNIYFSPGDGKIYKIFSDTKEIVSYFDVGSVVKIIIKNDDLFFLENNVSSYSIKKISNGILSTIGTIASSRTIVVSDFVIDSTGNFFVTFYENSLGNLGQTDTHCVYKVYGDKSKSPEIFIGGNVGLNDYNPNTSPTFSGSDYTRFTRPTKIQIDSSDNLYVYDSGNGYIKKITPNKILTRHFQLGGSIKGYTIDSNDYLYVIYNTSTQEIFITIDTKTPSRSNTRFNLSYSKTNPSSNINPIYSDSTPLKSRGYVQSFNILKNGNAYFTEDIGVSTYQKCLVKFNFNDYITNNIFNSEKIFFNPVNSPSNTKKYATGLSTGLVKGLCFNSNNDLFFSDESTHTVRKISSDNSKVIPIGGFVGLSGLNDGIIGKRGFIESNAYNTIFWNNNSLLVSSRGTSAGLTPIGIKSISFTNNTINTIYKTIPAPTCIVKDTSGNLFILTISSGIFKVDALGNITTFSNVVGHRMVIDSSNNLFVYNYLAGNIVFEIYKISPAGVSTTFKTRTQITSLMMQSVQGMCIDSVNNIYMSDGSRVLKLTSSGVDSIFYGPVGLANGKGMCIDPSDNIYVCDYASKCIVKIVPPNISNKFNSPNGITIDSSGNLYVTEYGNHIIRKITPEGVLTTFAGIVGTSGSANGTGSNAGFNNPRGITIDSSGNLYVCDSTNHTIRKITPEGVVTTIAGLAGLAGVDNGTGTAAKFNQPHGITIDSSGNLYVCDTLNHTIRKITPAGVVTTIAGLAGTSGSANGTGSIARFNYPQGIITDSANNLYVSDTNNNIIRKITSTGSVTTFAGALQSGKTDGMGTAARFNFPMGIIIDSTNNNLYVSDYYNNTIRKITPAGFVSTFAGNIQGSADGTSVDAKFNSPNGITIDPSGNLYVCDSANQTIRKITPATVVTTFAGTVGQNGTLITGGVYAGSPDWQNPSELAYDSNANEIYILGTNEIRKVSLVTTTVTKLYSDLGRLPYQIYNTTDGLLNTSVYNTPRGLCVDSNGNTYICDYGNNKIRKITPSGVTSTIATILYPIAITIDSSGNLFVIRTNFTYSGSKTNVFAVIYKVIPSTGNVTVFAGVEAGYLSPDSLAQDGTGTGARFADISSICKDSNDNLYIGDQYSIRKITSSGAVSTIAGNPNTTGSVDGVPSKLGKISGLVYHPSDKIYFIEIDYAKIKVLDLSTNAVATLAGSLNNITTEGKGKAAYLSAPLAIALNTQNELIITTSDYRFVKYSI